MLDITNSTSELSTYGGSELKKVYYLTGEKYMVKFPDPIREKNKNISYINNQYSEYIGCHIFAMLDIPVQETELVVCKYNGKEKIAVACKDFLSSNETLIEMKNLSYSLSLDKKYETSIEDVQKMISLVPNFINEEERNTVFKRFWQIFVVDALLGNSDRHLGNIGFIKKDNLLRIAPVYDCGSCLNPLLSVEDMKKYLNNSTELKNIAYNVTSVYKMNNQRIFYYQIFQNPPEELAHAIKEIVPKIDIEKIRELINSTPGLTDTQKEFYYQTIKIRKDLILDKAYNQIFA